MSFEASENYVSQHKPHCAHWQGIPVPNLIRYVHYCNEYLLKNQKPNCSFVSALHEFYVRSNGQLPNSKEELAHFWKTGSFPTRDLHLLEATNNATENTICGTCQMHIQLNTCMYQLPCGHAFHTEHTDHHVVDLLSFLRATNFCPTCRKKVNLQPQQQKLPTSSSSSSPTVSPSSSPSMNPTPPSSSNDVFVLTD